MGRSHYYPNERGGDTRIVNPYSIAYDQEDEGSVGAALPFTPHQRKLGLFAVALLLMSFSCFSWVRGPSNSTGQSSTVRLPAALEAALQKDESNLVGPRSLAKVRYETQQFNDPGSGRLRGRAEDRTGLLEEERAEEESVGQQAIPLQELDLPDEEAAEAMVMMPVATTTTTSVAEEEEKGASPEPASLGENPVLAKLLEEIAQEQEEVPPVVSQQQVKEEGAEQSGGERQEQAQPQAERMGKEPISPVVEAAEGVQSREVEKGKGSSITAAEESGKGEEAPSSALPGGAAEDKEEEEEVLVARAGSDTEELVEEGKQQQQQQQSPSGVPHPPPQRPPPPPVIVRKGGISVKPMTPAEQQENLRKQKQKKKEAASGQEQEVQGGSVDSPAQEEESEGASPIGLKPEVTRKLVVWLQADKGVEGPSSGKQAGSSNSRMAVSSWSSSTSEGVVFRPLEGQRKRTAELGWKNGLAQDRRLVDSKKDQQGGDDRRPPPTDLEGRSLVPELVTAKGNDGRRTVKAVSFPCSLVAPGVQLKDGQTVFVVLAPSWLEKGDQVPGQRFLGHYPYGQLRFHDGLLAFKTDSGDYLLEASQPHVREGRFLIAAYRFNSNVEMGINGRGFEAVANERGEEGEPPVFSNTMEEGEEDLPFLTVGGVNAECGYLGLIAEVLVFDSVLGDEEARLVSQYLGHKYGIELLHGKPNPRKDNKGKAEAARAARQVEEKQRAAEGGAFAIRARAGGSGPFSSRGAVGGEEEGKGVKEQKSRRADKQQQGEEDGGVPLSCREALEQSSVEEFQPPEAATAEDLKEWADGMRESKNRIRNYQGGGQALRDFIHGEVRALEKLRQKVFCKYVVGGGPAAN